MSYIPTEVIEQVRQVDLLTYMQIFEPEELVRISPNCYRTRTHDSLKISNGKWMWWSRGIGGYGALDYLVKVKGHSFLEAVDILVGKASVIPAAIIPKQKAEPPKELVLPEKSKATERITDYLFSRGIDYSVISYCISHGLIYESLPYHNIVFVGYDGRQKPRYAFFRATKPSRIMGDCPGSDKRFAFQIGNGDSLVLHLFECAIDLLSYASLERMAGRDWRADNLLSLSDVYSPKEKLEDSTVPMALSHFLTEHENVSKICLHLDNDSTGRAATRALKAILPSRYEVRDEPPPKGKDFNDYLCIKLGIPKDKTRERSVER